MRRFVLIAILLTPGLSFANPPAAEIEFFEKKIRPILVEQCQSCHGEKKQSGGLRLDTLEGFTAGADDGPVVLPGKPNESRLLKSVKREGEHVMPPKAALPAEQVALLDEWIRRGAVFPKSETKAVAKVDPKKHWAFQPLTIPNLPAVDGKTEIDKFVNEKLIVAKLKMNPATDRRTLLRRLSFDLIGLPPTYEEIKAFENDNDPKAVEKVVDRLLASPHYGERWGRHWLDVARYADSKGYVFTEDRNYPYAYTYRDYVIHAYNDDKPYDQFVMEQLAADRMDRKGNDKSLAALGFLTLGRRFLNNSHDIIDDRIDVVMRGMMGLTVGCARCHDHKYDPIPIAEYYSLYGVFAGSHEPKELPLLEPKSKEHIAFENELAKKEKAAQDYADKMYAEGLAPFRTAESVRDYLLAVRDAAGLSGMEVDRILLDRKLRQSVFDRWKNYLNAKGRDQDPVFSIWLAYASISDNDFAELAPAVLLSLQESKIPIHMYVEKAFEKSSPKTLREAAFTMGEVLATAAKSKEPAVKPLYAVLYGPDGPPSLPIPAEADKVVPIAVKKGYRELRNDAQKFRATSPAAPARAMALYDNESSYQPVVFLRGNPNNRGPQVPKQFLSIAGATERTSLTNGSGRLDMAKAIADAKNPLTARVYVNRIWMHLFDEGLVRTTSDFGVRSDPPTHPELLNWLASQFIAEGWSTKKLIRKIVLASVYQQQCDTTDAVMDIDPANLLLSRQVRKRHDFETLRDSQLFVSGTLEQTTYGRSVELFKEPFTTRRTIYGSVDRQNLPGTLRAFDFASPDQHAPQRFKTTVPQQSLYLMNSPFIVNQAKALSDRKEVKVANTIEAKVNTLFKLSLGREPTTEELTASVNYLTPKPGWGFLRPKKAASPLAQFAQILLLSNEFTYAD